MANLKEVLRQRRTVPKQTVTVDVPDLGMDEPVILQKVDYGDMKAIQKRGETDFAAAMLVKMVVDKDGNRVFQDNEESELDALSPESFQLIMEAANQLNGFNKDTEKNSEASQKKASESA